MPVTRQKYLPVFLVTCTLVFHSSCLWAAGAPSPEAPGAGLTLRVCLEEALAASPAITAGLADITGREAALRSAEKDRYPDLSVQYSYSKEPDAYAPFGIEDNYHFGVSLEQPVYQGKAIVTAIELEEVNLELARRNLAKTANDLIYSIYQAYYTLLQSRKLEEIARQAVVRLESHRKDARAFYDAGLIPKNDLLQSEVQLAEGRQDLLRSENATALAETRLNILLKRPLHSPVEIAGMKDFSLRPVNWEEAFQQALENRPEIEQAEAVIQQADRNITLARAPYLPSVMLSATYLKQGDNLLVNDYPLGPSEIKSAGATLRWRFWAWGQQKDEVAAARHDKRRAREKRRETVDAVTLDVRQAYLDLLQAEENIEVTRKAVEQAEENFRLNTARYQVQLGTSTEVLDAQALLTRAKNNFNNSLYDYRLALAELDWATGSLAAKYADLWNSN